MTKRTHPLQSLPNPVPARIAGMVAFSLNHARRWKRRFEDFDRIGPDRAGGDRP